MSNRTFVEWATLLALGCGGDAQRDFAVVDTASETWDVGGTPDDSAVLEENSSQGAWWRMHASLVIEEGEVSFADSFFDVEVLDETRAHLCSGFAYSSEAIREKITPHETVQYWWTIGVEGWSGTCQEMMQDERLPLSFQLGLGAMHPEILAVLDKLNEVQPGAEDLLHSAFASFDSGDSVLVFGAGGTAQDFAGQPGKSEPANLNGTYFIHPLYPFSLQSD